MHSSVKHPECVRLYYFTLSINIVHNSRLISNFVIRMTKEELVTRIRDIEWDDFEVKAAKSELPKNVWETVSAFSNTSGGWIVLGVKQSGKIFDIQGVDNIEKLEQFSRHFAFLQIQSDITHVFQTI